MKRVALWLVFVLLTLASWRAALGGEAGHDFAKWEKEISAFEVADRTNPPPKGAVLFIGSSIIRKWTTLAQDFPRNPVINRGFGGSEIVDSTHFADRIIFPYQPRMIVIRAGDNDLWAGKSAETVFADFLEFVATIHAALPQTGIVFIAPNPSPSRWKQRGKQKRLGELVEEYCRQTPGVKSIATYDMTLGPDGQPRPDLFVDDKLHLNAEGYKLLADRVRLCLPD